MAPLAPQTQLLAASRLFLREIDAAVEARRDFAFETTLAGRGHLALMRRLRAEGWRVELIHLALPSVEMSRQRVAERVAHGGHDIPRADIVRRFPRSLAHLLGEQGAQANRTRCYMNADGDFTWVFEQVDGQPHAIHPAGHDRLITTEAQR